MIDLKLTEDGDLVVGPDGDLLTVYGDEQLGQEILFRLKTTLGDWLLQPDIGASLEEFIGQPNIPLTHNLIKVRVLDELAKYNLVSDPDISVVPVGLNEILLLVEFPSVESRNRIVQIQAGLDLRKGLVFSRVATRQQ